MFQAKYNHKRDTNKQWKMQEENYNSFQAHTKHNISNDNDDAAAAAAADDDDDEPITRSEQLPCARVTAFSRTSLFLNGLARILNIF